MEANPHRPIRGILFDKDGTLIDFHASWVAAYGAGARFMANLAGDAGWAERLLDDGGYDAAEGCFRPGSMLTIATSDEIADAWAQATGLDSGGHDLRHRLKKIFDAEASRGARPLVNLGDLFAALRARGLRIGVATSDSTASVTLTLADLELSALVDFVAGFDAGHGGKPGPGMVLGFCEHTGLSPAEVAVVGDTLHDMEMARAAGAGLAIGVLSGVGSREDLLAVADHVLESIASLEPLLSAA